MVIMPMDMNTHIICTNNLYYPGAYADIFCMGSCCNSPLLGRKVSSLPSGMPIRQEMRRMLL